MDGRGRMQDNIFIERLWWSLKYQYVAINNFQFKLEYVPSMRLIIATEARLPKICD